MLRTPIKLNRPVTAGAMNSNAHLKFNDTTVDLLNQTLFATKTKKNSIKLIKKSRIFVNYKKICPQQFIALFRCVIALQ